MSNQIANELMVECHCEECGNAILKTASIYNNYSIVFCETCLERMREGEDSDNDEEEEEEDGQLEVSVEEDIEVSDDDEESEFDEEAEYNEDGEVELVDITWDGVESYCNQLTGELYSKGDGTHNHTPIRLGININKNKILK